MKNDVKVIIQYLTILELPLDKAISKEIVKAQYHKLAKIYHPDGHQDVYTDGERFKLLHEAYTFCTNNIDYINELISKDFSQSNTSQKNNGYSNKSKDNGYFDKSDFIGFVNAVQTSLSIFGLPIDRRINLPELNKLYGIIYLQVRNNHKVYSAIKSAYEFLSSNIDLTNMVIDSEYNFDTFNSNLEKENTRKQAEAEAKAAREKAEKEKREKEAEEYRKAQEEKIRFQKELQAKKEKEKRESREFFIKKIEEHKNKTDFSLFSQKSQERISSLYLKYKTKTDSISTFDDANVFFERFIQECNLIPTLKKEKARKRIIIYSFVSLFCVLAVVSGIIGGIQIYKNNRYKQAISLLENGDYSSALQLLDSLSGYKESDKISVVARSLNKLNGNSKEFEISSAIEDLSNILNYSDIYYHSETYTIASNFNDYTSRFLNGDFVFYYPPTNSGYDVGTWRYKAASYHHSTNSCDFYLDANWVPHSYSITYDLDGGINSSKNPTMFNCEQGPISLFDPSKEGYTFSGWFDSKSGVNKISVIDTSVKQDVKLYAKWNINLYTVTFKNWDGTVLEEKQVEYNSDVVYSGVTPTRDDINYMYTWSGWDKSTKSIKSDTTLIATFDLFSKGLAFTFSGTDYAVSSYVGSSEKIIIPQKYNNYEVKYIMDGVFSNCSFIKNVVLPSSIRTIGNNSFEKCNNLVDISLSSGLVSIGANAFKGCNSLVLNQLPLTIEELGDYAFSDCLSLKNLSIPSSIKTLGDYCFSGCEQLKNISLPNTVTKLPSGFLKGCISIEQYTISPQITELGDYCLADTSIQNITIPQTVNKIGKFAFSGTKITSLTIPNEIVLSESSLSGLACLSILSIPCSGYEYDKSDYSNNRTYFYHYPLGYYFGTTGLNSDFISISQMNYIYYFPWPLGNSTAHHVSTYSNYVFPKTLKTLTITKSAGCYSLLNLSTLNTLTLADSVSMSFNCCQNCSSLTTVNLPDTTTVINEYAFSGCTSLKNITIPKSTEIIRKNAFEKCYSLSSIRIPISVSYIGSNAFLSCSGLTIFCEASSKPSKWENDWNPSNCTVVWNA